ncbi:bifunctional phosphoribosyl-AMP cyclohydrolase/phosphoribosyl-ATP diphosphatase HisIE [Legionella israelensis]|uniref:Histidine biosynthesis bifunctional protein HisIE n=2 Tax=Legionella israelensis TaxID=454 RepID=A0A0W0WDS5_9GAMM|nr:bifunctional phosphoribosyl-AMP cyclohydrolase/phosphoribosyl-ATP diphosphatase HisIE [Legionella israelensis]KTD30487.1 bifunctional phosphoribosyl-AMP cyclohydrolase/phosphoribosyl-ATP pyrophosphatase protein [Legionella israelensis]QBR83479.1 bifunctional phosphoribosyl-AMP cyclohydrolase/phosphoribosyl-ATP diphosphatase HisIE [Legionella israelensis]QBS09137.1 bifunctional phosphoribosyl-AMP cyclohydrolase/phosphoribosyl-ATP diphosphatase HisIE [Legionella israelensis]SCY24776.1 phosphor
MYELMNKLDWQKMNGLIPAVIQDEHTGRVLMLGYMNREALELTLKTGQLTFYSRSKQRLWRKGETSGNTVEVKSISTDCDADSLLIMAKPAGPCCHLGEESCFQGSNTQPPLIFLQQLIQLIKSRSEQTVENSYTNQLFYAGVKRCAQKVGEEAVETAIAAVSEPPEFFLNEAADLMFHFLVLLQACETDFYELMAVLQARHH